MFTFLTVSIDRGKFDGPKWLRQVLHSVEDPGEYLGLALVSRKTRIEIRISLTLTSLTLTSLPLLTCDSKFPRDLQLQVFSFQRWLGRSLHLMSIFLRLLIACQRLSIFHPFHSPNKAGFWCMGLGILLRRSQQNGHDL